jgi:hypothetical protein
VDNTNVEGTASTCCARYLSRGGAVKSLIQTLNRNLIQDLRQEHKVPSFDR